MALFIQARCEVVKEVFYPALSIERRGVLKVALSERQLQFIDATDNPKLAFLIERIHDLILSSEKGVTLLYNVCAAGAYELAEFLLKDIHVNPAQKNDDLVVNDVLARSSTPLHVAARKECFSIVRLLVEYGAPLDEPDSVGHTPLYHAIVKSEDLSFWLMSKGANVEVCDHEGGSLMLIACAFGSLNVIRELATRGVSVTKPGDRFSSAQTPLHMAIRWRRPEVVSWLLKNGAQPTIDYRKCDRGSTALATAVTMGCVAGVSLLVDGGADLSLKYFAIEASTGCPFYRDIDILELAENTLREVEERARKSPTEDGSQRIEAQQTIIDVLKVKYPGL